MNTFYKTQLEILNSTVTKGGVDIYDQIGARITIETDDEGLHDSIISAIQDIEAKAKS